MFYVRMFGTGCLSLLVCVLRPRDTLSITNGNEATATRQRRPRRKRRILNTTSHDVDELPPLRLGSIAYCSSKMAVAISVPEVVSSTPRYRTQRLAQSRIAEWKMENCLLLVQKIAMAIIFPFQKHPVRTQTNGDPTKTSTTYHRRG